jgi:putative membrane protein
MSSGIAAERPDGGEPHADVRDYLAEERTFLAWIRTILGVMGFGFLVSRIEPSALGLGAALIVIGAALSVLAVQRHRRMVQALNHPRPGYYQVSRQGIFLALLIAVAGVAMTLYLILRPIS